MSMKIQVLALNDDNHATCFITRGSYYNDAVDFMKDCLLKPHTVEYDVRFVALVDMEGDEDEIMRIFDLCACTYDIEKLAKEDYNHWLEREEAFDYLWSIGETNKLYL